MTKLADIWDSDTYSYSDLHALKWLSQENIDVQYIYLEEPYNGAYIWCPDTQPIIALSERIREDFTLKRCVLFEEIGHHFTLTEELRLEPQVLYNTHGRGELPVVEKQALRWASLQLVTDLEIRWFIKDGGGVIDEFARRFRITHEMAIERLNALKAHNPTLFRMLLKKLLDFEAKPDRSWWSSSHSDFRILG